MNNRFWSKKDSLRESHDHFIRQMQSGYDDGLAGRPYKGKTFVGLYAWMDGRDGLIRPPYRCACEHCE